MNFNDLIKNNYFVPQGVIEVEGIGSLDIYPLTVMEALEMQEVFSKVESMTEVDQIELITKWAARITGPTMPTDDDIKKFVSSVPMSLIKEIFEQGMEVLKGQSEAEEKN